MLMNTTPINGWINLYKPLGITSAYAVGRVKRLLPKGTKIGHTGTLDPEAEGILPLAIGEATKLVQFLMDARKTYRFKIQFGAKTDTADKVGKIVATSDVTPTEEECYAICEQFTGEITQTPPAFSALKVNGVRAYDLARQNQEVILQPRKITIFKLKCIGYDGVNRTATYEAECSKGTYIRTLAEDISLSLQSLGFVLELARTIVGMFDTKNSIELADLEVNNEGEALLLRPYQILGIDSILVDIPVLDIDDAAAYKVRCGQLVLLSDLIQGSQEYDLRKTLGSSPREIIWLRHTSKLLAIGKLCQGRFDSARVFNL